MSHDPADRTSLRMPTHMGLLAIATLASGCLFFGNETDDGEEETPAEWTFEGAEDPILVGARATLSIDGPKSCSGSTFGFGGSCTFSTIDRVESSAPDVVTVEQSDAGSIVLRAHKAGIATIFLEATTPDNQPTEGTTMVRVAEPAGADLEVFTTCGEGVSLDTVALPPRELIGLSATFTDALGNPLVGDDVAPPLTVDPQGAGTIDGQIVDGHTDFVSLTIAYDIAVPEIAVTLPNGTELEHLTIANASTIDRFDIGETTYNPNLNEVFVYARLAVGDRRICFDEYNYPDEVEYQVAIDTPDVCDFGFGEQSTRGVTGFGLEPRMTGDCKVTLSSGASLTESLTIAVTAPAR
ncbi:MAG: hypothetical protein HOW73_12755 [Polyangiaceae bacterium]|nr:hypothetical protein [Polyangiaceae bacterium]